MIYFKIDHVIYNTDWFLKFPKCEIEFLHAHISDYILIKVQQRENGGRHQGIHREFKFLNCIVDQLHFGKIVHTNWSRRMIGQPQYIMWNKLMRLKHDLRGLIHRVTDGVKNIQNARLKLEQDENKLEIDLFNQKYIAKVHKFTKEVLHTTDMEEQLLRQK